MHFSLIETLMTAILFCFVRAWQLMLMFLCRLALALTLKATEKTHVSDPERAIAYGW
jgi:hypothetical protein